jgi:hypothetical protein
MGTQSLGGENSCEANPISENPGRSRGPIVQNEPNFRRARYPLVSCKN